MKLAQEHSKEDSLVFNRYFLGFSSSLSILSAISFNIDWVKEFQLHSKFLNMFIIDRNEEAILLFHIIFKFKFENERLSNRRLGDTQVSMKNACCRKNFFGDTHFLRTRKFIRKFRVAGNLERWEELKRKKILKELKFYIQINISMYFWVRYVSISFQGNLIIFFALLIEPCRVFLKKIAFITTSQD